MFQTARLLAVVSVCAVVFAVPGAAQSVEKDPTAPIFKRVKPPSAGTTRRITVQLTKLPEIPDPLPEPPRSSDVAQAVPDLPDGAGYEWYWSMVSHSIDQAGPARVRRALDVLALKPEDSPLRSPRLQSLQNIADIYGAEIVAVISRSPISAAAVSSAGATGLMQLMPATAERFGVDDSTDPRDNIEGGVAYMNWLLQEFGGDVVLALAGYNAGENAVKRHEGVPPYSETRAYVPKVLAAFQVARGLCLTPPDLISDPCVFVGRRTAANG